MAPPFRRTLIKRNVSSVDRLGELPDDVVCHILSFLPTKISVSTNCLAKRWRYLWTHVPNLNFKGDDFEDKTHDSDIIHRVIVLHQAKIMNTFSLYDVNCNEYQLATCITHAINCGVQNLYIGFGEDYIGVTSLYGLFTLPRCFLTCKTLVDVKLDYCRGISSSGKVFLPSLKKLHLSRIKYEDNESLPHLLSGCPVLEDLIIKGCYKVTLNDHPDRLCRVSVSSPTIKILNVDLLCGCHILKINAPSLRHLNVKNCCLEDITSVRTMTSLIEADFSLFGDWNVVERDIDDTKNAVQFLNCLRNLKCLKISTDKVDKVVNIVGLDSVVKFDNLTKLKLDFICDWYELVKFLEVAKNLEVLTFTLGGMHYTYREPKVVPACMLSRLKTVRTKRFYVSNAHDFETIRYVMRNAQVLERMEIYSYYSSYTEKLELLGRISSLERGSELCQLAFY